MYNGSTEIYQLAKRQQKLHCYFIFQVLNVAELFSNMYNIENFKDIIRHSEQKAFPSCFGTCSQVMVPHISANSKAG